MVKKGLDIRDVMERLDRFYKIAMSTASIRKPWAWALYQTWTIIDQIEPERRMK